MGAVNVIVMWCLTLLTSRLVVTPPASSTVLVTQELCDTWNPLNLHGVSDKQPSFQVVPNRIVASNRSADITLEQKLFLTKQISEVEKKKCLTFGKDTCYGFTFWVPKHLWEQFKLSCFPVGETFVQKMLPLKSEPCCWTVITKLSRDWRCKRRNFLQLLCLRAKCFNFNLLRNPNCAVFCLAQCAAPVSAVEWHRETCNIVVNLQAGNLFLLHQGSTR